MELLIALAGPVCSVLLALLFLGAGYLVERFSVHVAVMMSWLFMMNMALGIFNLIPGFPLDGGRVLRAVIWAVSGNYAAATRDCDDGRLRDRVVPGGAWECSSSL